MSVLSWPRVLYIVSSLRTSLALDSDFISSMFVKVTMVIFKYNDFCLLFNDAEGRFVYHWFLSLNLQTVRSLSQCLSPSCVIILRSD